MIQKKKKKLSLYLRPFLKKLLMIKKGINIFFNFNLII